MNISLIIPAHNEELYIKECIESVIKNSNNKFLEIIVIDNASNDNTALIASEFKNIKVIREENKGLTHARERGLKEAKGDYLAYIDADCILPIGWIEKVEKIFLKEKNIVSLSGPYRYHDASKIDKIIMEIFWWTTAPVSYFFVGYMILGGNFVARKSTLIEIGGFDTSIKFYGEDTNIARRLSKKGKTKWSMSFFIHTSLRRIKKEGLLKTNLRYAMNFLWEVVFKKPFTKEYQDIRMEKREIKDINPKTKAILVTLFFFLIGFFEIIHNINYTYIIPISIFYLTLTLNTFFSIKLFSEVIPSENKLQIIIDLILVLVYIITAISMHNVLYFTFSLIFLFITATIKYALYLNKSHHLKLFKRKILIDISGILACTLALLGIISGYQTASIWILSIIFFLINIILLIIKPMYRLDNEQDFNNFINELLPK
ncbi:MAG: glycosyltransferase family 2 protein [Candidatus Nomurabacteria bacterium]